MEKQNEKKAKMPEEATTVGMFLKYTRLNQKKTIDAVAKALCIRKVYIKAIEDSDFTELQPVPYGIGFVRTYAEYLGLNSDRIVQCYKEEALPKKTNEVVKSAVLTQKIMIMPNRRHILISIAAVVVLYLIWLMISSKPETVQENTAMTVEEMLEPVTDSAESMPQAETEVAEPVEEQIKIVEDSYYEEPAAPATEPTTSRVVVKFNGESWFQIRDAKKVYISGIFQKGFEYTVPDVPGLEFSVGRYYNVDVYIDGQLTQVARPRKQTRINLDDFLNH